jgi:hypothetical protein
MTVEGPRKGESSLSSMRNGLQPQPARSVRGSSRRIMAMRFRPANIRVINRRASSWAVIGPAVQTGCSRLTSGNVFPLRRPSKYVPAPERCSPARVRFGTPNNGVPLPAPRRSGQAMVRRAAPAGTLYGSFQRGRGRLPSLRRRAGLIKKNALKVRGLNRVTPYQKLYFSPNCNWRESTAVELITA